MAVSAMRQYDVIQLSKIIVRSPLSLSHHHRASNCVLSHCRGTHLDPVGEVAGQSRPYHCVRSNPLRGIVLCNSLFSLAFLFSFISFYSIFTSVSVTLLVSSRARVRVNISSRFDLSAFSRIRVRMVSSRRLAL